MYHTWILWVMELRWVFASLLVWSLKSPQNLELVWLNFFGGSEHGLDPIYIYIYICIYRYTWFNSVAKPIQGKPYKKKVISSRFASNGQNHWIELLANQQILYQQSRIAWIRQFPPAKTFTRMSQEVSKRLVSVITHLLTFYKLPGTSKYFTL